MNIGVILAAGDSSRFGGYINKQYLKLNGKEAVYYTISKFRECKEIDKIILVVDKEEYKSCYIQDKYKVECICGGDTRNESIFNALDYIERNYCCEKILFHDSVRPATKLVTFKICLELLDQYEAVVACNNITDGVVDKDFKPILREDYKLIQTPEAFRFNCIKGKINPNSNINSIVGQLNLTKIYSISTDVFNNKITYPNDLFMLEQLMNIDYYSVKHNENFIFNIKEIGNVLLLGASGGIGQAIKNYFIENNVVFYAPTHKELDLQFISVEKLNSYLNGRKINCVINAAAIYYDDSAGLLNTFNEIFDINVKANLALIEYAKTTKTKFNIVTLSSSSSTKGRENLTNYSASKIALNSIVQAQANILAKQNIYLNAVIPEKVKTPLIEKLHKTKINDRELLNPKDVLNVIIYYAISKDFGKLVHIRKGM